MSHRYQVVSVNPCGSSHDERWGAFCADVVSRIEAIRLEVADPTCSTCGHVQARMLDFKRCASCTRSKPVTAFRIDSRNNRPRSWCMACDRERLAINRKRQALRAIGRAS